ncbi:MAG: hypothetical protein AAF633_09120, partial [Chloroflexota bacterium]
APNSDQMSLVGAKRLAIPDWNYRPNLRYGVGMRGDGRENNQNKSRFVRFLEEWRRFIPMIKLRSYRTVLAFLTLVILGLVGMIELYANDPTFGDTILSDYLRLIVWGVGSNATQEGLFQLVGNLGSKLQPNAN